MTSKSLATLTFGALLALAAPASAGLIVAEWYFGQWDCTIDGREAHMYWKAGEVQNTTCNGDVCTSSSEIQISGSFQDGSAPWVPLKRVASNPAMLQMRHPDGNLWYLANRGKTAEGWTTWNGRRYALYCWRKGSGKFRAAPRVPKSP